MVVKEQQQLERCSGSRRVWKAVFALLLTAVMAFSFAPELSAGAIYLISDGVSTVAADDTERVEENRVVAKGLTEKESNVTLKGGRKVIIHHGGVELYATSRENESISELLRREAVALGPLEMVFVDLSGEDAVLSIASNFTYYETVPEMVPYGTVYETDYTLPKDTTVVAQKGENGFRDVTYEVVYADGVRISRQRVAESEATVKDEIIRVGTLVTEAQPGDTVASVVWKEDGSGYLRLKSGDSLHFSGSMAVTCTAYSSEQRTVGTVTATGTKAEVGVAAVDRRVIPLGTKLFVTTDDGSYTYGMARAEDTGVRGKSIDLYMDTIRECRQFGRRNGTVYFLDR